MPVSSLWAHHHGAPLKVLMRTCSIASYDTREDNTGVSPGDALRDIQEYVTGLGGEDSRNLDEQIDAERPLLDSDSAHEDESLHKAFIRRRTMTVSVGHTVTLVHCYLIVP